MEITLQQYPSVKLVRQPRLLKMEITLEQYPSLKAAHKLLKAFPKAIIAGGAPRDIFNGRDFNDVDIFIPISQNWELAECAMKLGQWAAEANKDPVMDPVYRDVGGRVRIGIDNMDICLINLPFENGDVLVQQFDMLASQAWLEPIDTGFEVKATDLFYELNDKKILGIYAKKVSSRDDLIESVNEIFGGSLQLSPEDFSAEIDFDPENPF